MQKLRRADSVLCNALLAGVHDTPGKSPVSHNLHTSTAMLPYPCSQCQEKVASTCAFLMLGLSVCRNSSRTDSVLSHIQPVMTNIRSSCRQRAATAGQTPLCHTPTVPGTAGSATLSVCRLCVMRGVLWFGPPLHVARGASFGGRVMPSAFDSMMSTAFLIF